MLFLLQGKCYDGICQASVQLVEVKSIPPLGTFPDNNTQWVWLRLTANAIGEVTTLASQSGVTQPGVVDGNIVTTAPEDPRTPGSPIGSALKLATGLVEGEKAEATVVYRNNTPSHPLGLFNGMKVRAAGLHSVEQTCRKCCKLICRSTTTREQAGNWLDIITPLNHPSFACVTLSLPPHSHSLPWITHSLP
jgi:hypothetical protein